MAIALNLKKPNERPSLFARIRLIVAACLLLGWLGWLGYLAATVRGVVLSRPQFLISTLDVIATVQQVDGHPGADVVVDEVHWPTHGEEALIGKTIAVTNLPTVTAAEGWRGPGKYILPLVTDGAAYRVASIPYSPGYAPHTKDQNGNVIAIHQIRIYPLTADTRRQLDSIAKAALSEP